MTKVSGKGNIDIFWKLLKKLFFFKSVLFFLKTCWNSEIYGGMAQKSFLQCKPTGFGSGFGLAEPNERCPTPRGPDLLPPLQPDWFVLPTFVLPLPEIGSRHRHPGRGNFDTSVPVVGPCPGPGNWQHMQKCFFTSPSTPTRVGMGDTETNFDLNCAKCYCVLDF